MKKSTLFLSFQIILLVASAQTFQWLATEEIDYTYNPEMIHYATATDELENSYLYGIKEHVDFYNKSYGIVLLNKYDAEGQLLWSKEIDGLSSACGIETNTSGDVYIIGSYRADLNFWDEGSLEYSGTDEKGFLAKIQSDGSFSWALGLFDLYTASTIPTDIVVNGDGNVFVGHTGWPESFISEFNEDGDLVTDITQTSAGLISGIDVDSEGNIYSAGSCSGIESLFGGVNFSSSLSYSLYIAKYDDSGTPLWVEFIEDVTCVRPAVRVSNDGGIYLSGPLASATMFGDYPAEGPSWVYDFFLTRLSPEGEFEWVWEVPQEALGDAGPGPLNHIDVTSEGNVVFTGVTRGSVDWGSGLESEANLYYDIFLTEINSEGEMLWVKTAGGVFYDIVHSVSVSSMGNIFLAGTAGDTTTFDTIVNQSELYTHPFLAKVNMGITTGIEKLEKTNLELMVFPNPATSGQVSLSFQNIISAREFELQCFNTTGRQVYQQQIPTHTAKPNININDWLPGIYLLVAYAEGKLVGETKLVIK